MFVKPVLASVVMGAAVWAVYGLMVNVLTISSKLATLLAIGVGVVVYLVLVLSLRALSKEDLDLMPKGDKIANSLRIR